MGIGSINFHQLDQQTRHHQCRACNKSGSQAAPEHMLSCAHTRKRRHDAVVIAVQQAISAAGVNSEYEHQIQQSQSKIDLLLKHPQPNSANQANMMIDVTILGSYQYKTDQLPNTTNIYKTANAKEINKYKNAALQLKASIQPLAFTTFGGMSTKTKDFFKEIQHMAIIKQRYYPDIDRSFRVVWQENIAFASARATANCACDAAVEHRKMHAHHV